MLSAERRCYSSLRHASNKSRAPQSELRCALHARPLTSLRELHLTSDSAGARRLIGCARAGAAKDNSQRSRLALPECRERRLTRHREKHAHLGSGGRAY